MVWAAAVPALIGAAGAIGGGLLGAKGAKASNKTNLRIAREQMEFQERMSSTSYQRGIKDMEAAGLNPILAYSQGGASSPSGATTHVENAMAPVAASASQAAGLVGGIMNNVQSASSANLMDAQADKAKSETFSSDMNLLLRQMELDRIMAEADRHRAGSAQSDAERNRIDEASRNLVAERLGITADSESKYGLYQAYKGKGVFGAKAEKELAESKLSQLDVPRAQAENDFFEHLGKANPYLRALIMLMRGMSGARSAGIGR